MKLLKQSNPETSEDLVVKESEMSWVTNNLISDFILEELSPKQVFIPQGKGLQQYQTDCQQTQFLADS